MKEYKWSVEVIEQSTREEIDTNEIPEIEPPAEPGDDVVE